jgi:molybdopterin synthase catalytic subunit
MIHRIGRVEIGEASVVIAVASPHRGEAFDACEYAIDTLKASVPIWKKEHFADGEVWVGLQS